ncbi:MAG: flagellar hook-length control protein FliK [Phycisphaerales bacterium]|nr:MAG: flagellar hook-length control protein FliK [Phycisphaerales bacterium]
MIAQGDVSLASVRQPKAPSTPAGDPGPGDFEAAPDGPVFADLFAATQAMFGNRITTFVDSIVPDGRGLKPSAADASEKRLAQLSDDARLARQQRRKHLRDEAWRNPPRARVNKTDQQRKANPPCADQRGRLSSTASTDAGRSRRAAPGSKTTGPAPGMSTSSGGDRSVERPSPPRVGAGDGQRIMPSAPRLAGAAGGKPLEAQCTAPAAISGGATVSASSRSDGGALAGKIGEVLGARAAPESGRSASATQSTPAPDGPAGRRGQAGAHPRGTGQSDRTPRQRAQAKGMPAPRQAAFDRLVRFIRMNVGQRESSARLQLTPPELGRVRIDVRLVQQRMELLIQAETRDARNLLASRLDGLRGALANHGVTIDRLELPDPTSDGAQQAPVGNHDDSRRRNSRDVGYAGDDRSGPVAAGDLADDEQTGPPEWADTVFFGAASEMRLDIRA